MRQETESLSSTVQALRASAARFSTPAPREARRDLGRVAEATAGLPPHSAKHRDKAEAEAALRVLVVDRNASDLANQGAQCSVLEAGLRDAGYRNVTVVHDLNGLLRRIMELNPDVVIADLGDPSRDVLSQMFQLSRCIPKPLALFVEQSDAATISAAVEAGVAAYVVDGLKKERVKSVLDTALSRFHVVNRLRDELDRTKQALEERKLIERAKGMLMKDRGLTEEAAYTLLRKAAMNESKRIGEVALSVVSAALPAR